MGRFHHRFTAIHRGVAPSYGWFETPMTSSSSHARLASWIDAHFDEEVGFLADIVRIPTDTPPGDNAPHAEAVAAMIGQLGWQVERQSFQLDIAQ